ncbi:MAG: transposase [Burkholderiales bacterium]|nr:transposase [Burkholderiales bacterium]MDR4518407.1 transposase [Nitrosomonas sp.]
MTDCTQRSFNFPEVKKCVVEVNFEGGDITSDGGVLLLRQADRLIGLSQAVASKYTGSEQVHWVWSCIATFSLVIFKTNKTNKGHPYN